MRRDEFLRDLELRLEKLPEDQRRDVLADYAEHFDIGAEKGKSDEEIARGLGSPRQIAAACLANLAVARIAESQTVGRRIVSIVRALFAVLGLVFFNGVFVLIPLLMLLSFVAMFWCFALTPLIAGVTLIFSAAVSYGAELVASMEGLGHLFLSLGLMSLGALLVLVMGLVSKWLANATLGYLRLNVQIIKG